MFVEYLRILDRSGGDLGSQWQLTGKLAIIAAVGTLLIYIGYKLLGKSGAIGMLIILVLILALANDMVPFIRVY
ncbi:MAG: hypothetical protein OET63_13925 [Desulfobacterales bacterium]|jgi:hypothetical protein|nr:hypothetical protein [Desulfobacterales bacterium]